MGLSMKDNQKGFTIIEMLIATAILSTILVLITTMMVNIGSLYYKGINQSKIQGTVRSVTDELSQQLQVLDTTYRSSAPLNAGGKTYRAYCIGTTRYIYVLDVALSNGQQHVLWRDNNGSGVCTAADLNAALPAGGIELMPPSSRLTLFTINGVTPGASPYLITIGAAYTSNGDNDLLNGVGLGVATRCNGGQDRQFCSTAHLETVVAKRLQ